MPDGQQGEILTRGPELFTGYTDPALNATAFLPGGWFRTGDIGRIDADGHLTVTDRLKDIIIRGGENISSKEVEDLLITHPAVADVAVIPVPDPALGERVCAVVVARPGFTFDVDQAREHFAAAGAARQKTLRSSCSRTNCRAPLLARCARTCCVRRGSRRQTVSRSGDHLRRMVGLPKSSCAGRAAITGQTAHDDLRGRPGRRAPARG